MTNTDYMSYIYQGLQMAILGFPLVVGAFTALWKYYQKLSKLSENLEKISKEFLPNSGSSMRDVVDSIDKRVCSLDLVQKSYMDADSSLPIFQTDINGKCLWANKAYIRLCGRPIEEVLGYGWILSVPQEERFQVESEWLKAIAEKRNFEHHYHFTNDQTKVKTKVVCKAQGNDKSGYIGFIYLDEGV